MDEVARRIKQAGEGMDEEEREFLNGQYLTLEEVFDHGHTKSGSFSCGRTLASGIFEVKRNGAAEPLRSRPHLPRVASACTGGSPKCTSIEQWRLKEGKKKRGKLPSPSKRRVLGLNFEFSHQPSWFPPGYASMISMRP